MSSQTSGWARAQVSANSASFLRSHDQSEVLSSSMPAHLDLYFNNFKSHQKFQVKQQAREAMDIDIGGQPSFSALQRPLLSQHQDEVDHFAHNHFSVAPFWYTDLNQRVKLDYRHASLKDVTSSMAKSLGQALLKQTLSQNGQGTAISQMIRGEFETWELMKAMELVDRVYFKHQTLSKNFDKCPKTVMQSDFLKRHDHLVILGAARWLENTYQDQSGTVLDNSHYLNSQRITDFVDFDKNKHLDDQNFARGERKLFQSIIEHLRSGKLWSIQDKLKNANCFEQFLMLNSTNPIFDNVQFKEQISDTEDLFLQDWERQNNINFANESYDETFEQSSVYGNRNYLMFIQQYHEVFKNALTNNDASMKAELETLRKGIIGLQCGDIKATEALIDRLQHSTSGYKDQLWMHFRNTAQRIQINLALQGKEDGSLDSFETFYSDFIDERQLESLNQTYQNPVQFSDISQVINEALSRSKTRGLNFFENVQAQILRASFLSSSNRGMNTWDELLSYLAHETDREIFFYYNGEEEEQPELKKQEFTLRIRLAAHIVICLLLNGRILHDERSIRNYNQILQTYIDELISIKKPERNQRELEPIIFYISFLVGEKAQTQVYTKFLISVEDTQIRKEIEKINKLYFKDELARKFMVALAESGINQAGEEFLDTLSPEDQKAIQIIEWLYDQKDTRNAFYYTNEFSRKLLLQDRLKGVTLIMNKFPIQAPNDILVGEIQAFLEERKKIERLAQVILAAQQLQLLDSDLDYYRYEEEMKRSSRMEIDNRNSHINYIYQEINELLFSELMPGSIVIADSFIFQADPQIQADYNRLNSIDQVNQKFAFDLLRVLFRCHFSLSHFDHCLTFLTDVKARERQLLDYAQTGLPRFKGILGAYVSKEGVQALMHMVTECVLKSQKIMTEVLFDDDDDLQHTTGGIRENEDEQRMNE